MAAQIRFGVELEMVVRPKDETLQLLTEHFDFCLEQHSMTDRNFRDDNRDEIIKFLRAYFVQAGVQVNIPAQESSVESNSEDIDDSPARDSEIESDSEDIDYSNWTVTDDPTIKSGPECYGIEIVSPIFVTNVGERAIDSTGSWQAEIEKIWRIVEACFDIVTEDWHQCDTHIHISPINGFTRDQVSNVAQYVQRFSTAITYIPGFLRSQRIPNEYARPNFEVRPKPTLGELHSELSIEELVGLMMPRRQELQSLKVSQERFVAWNFLPLLLEAKGTIEYRQLPQFTQFEEAELAIQKGLYLCFRALSWHE